MNILMIGVYNIDNYSRGRVLYKGLIKNNVNVDLYLPRGRLKYFYIIKRLLNKNYDFVLVNGKICFFISKLLKLIHKRPIIFDVFISDYDNLVNDRKLVKKDSVRSKLLWLIDQYSCKFADYVILDTYEHINYFVKEFGLNRNKFQRVFVGSDENIFHPMNKSKSKRFIVYFQGTFIPLQGIEYIIKSAKLLEDYNDIEFNIVGYGQTFNEILKLSQEINLRNVKFFGHKRLEELPSYIANADICLGIFGKTGKAKRVIPNKVFEYIAMKKPVITGDTPAIKELITNKKNCILCEIGNEKSLANAILKLKNNDELREKLAKDGYLLFKKKSSSKLIGKKIISIIKGIN